MHYITCSHWNADHLLKQGFFFFFFFGIFMMKTGIAKYWKKLIVIKARGLKNHKNLFNQPFSSQMLVPSLNHSNFVLSSPFFKQTLLFDYSESTIARVVPIFMVFRW